jgi:DNA replication protein DnaC
MNNQTTLDRFKELKLEGMANAYEAILKTPIQEQSNYQIIVNRLLEAEHLHRQQKRTEMYLKLSNIRYNAVIEQVECNPSRNLAADQLASISDCSFIQRAENVLITGATGCGKSYLACALGREACSKGYKVYYFGMSRFMEKIAITKVEGTYIKMINSISKADLFILDDFGLTPLDTITRLALLQILEDRYGIKSTMIISQLPTQSWYDYIAEPTLADAIMDRLFSSAHRFDLKGESLRKKIIKF